MDGMVGTKIDTHTNIHNVALINTSQDGQVVQPTGLLFLYCGNII